MAYGTGTNPGIETGPDAEPPAGVWRSPFGPVIFQCMIETRAYPWKAPKVTRTGRVFKRSQPAAYNRWKSWCADITMAMMTLYRMEVGYCLDSVVDLDTLFVMDGRHPCGDATNLRKSFEDILQGIVYVNDRQVQGGELRRVFLGDPIIGREGDRWDGAERIHFRVTSLG
jgi:Holliday junction resolvase RusA-like endonuclease